jgi:asparagine synthase (glutamine-hydrolysing)
MCGITGFQGQFDEKLLSVMAKQMVHRGPDGQGKVFFKGASDFTGLAHARLSIIDLSDAGHQPMSVECDRCQKNDVKPEQKLWLTYNGELYNYKKLKAELSARGHSFFSQSDSEVILHCYAEYGPGFLEKLNGIYAFALYDGRLSGQKEGVQPGDLIIARDGFGVKPLYYSSTQQGILFASELKSLLCSDSVEREIDLTALDHYLTYLWSPGEQTMLKSVKKLCPGHAMLIRNHQIQRHWQYYDVPVGQEKNSNMSFDSAATQLKEKLSSAIERQMIADVPVGAFLSGGLDSSSIVALMRDQNPDMDIDCFTIRTSSQNNEGFSNDLPYAQKVAKHLKVNLHIVDAQPNMIMRLPEMLYHLDEPQADPAPINALMISELAQSLGVKVLMSGAGGDDLFTGYRRHYALQLDKYWQWAPRKIKEITANYCRHALSGGGFGVNQPVTRRILKLLKDCDKSGDDRTASFFAWSNANIRNRIYSDRVRSNFISADDHSVLLESLNYVNDCSRLDKMLYLELKHFLVDHNFNYTDKMSMAKGVEVRVPLLDPDLVRFAFTIPDYFKQKGKVGKAVFKRAMEPFLPRNVIYRPKTGFGAPLRHWLHHDLKEIISEVLSEKSLNARGLFNPKTVSNLIELDKSGKADVAYVIFALFSVELWCRQFIDVKIPTMLTF